MKNRVDSITQAVTYPLPFLHNNSSILWKPIKSAQSNQIYGKLYSLKYDGACRSKGPVHGYEAIRLKQIYKNRFIERREHAKHPSGGSSTRQSYCDSPEANIQNIRQLPQVAVTHVPIL